MRTIKLAAATPFVRRRLREVDGGRVEARIAQQKIEEQQAEEQFAASVPLMQNEISDAEGPGFDAKRLATTWEWVAKAQGMQIDALDPASAIDTSLSE